jgi:hypothetical protein
MSPGWFAGLKAMQREKATLKHASNMYGSNCCLGGFLPLTRKTSQSMLSLTMYRTWLF